MKEINWDTFVLEANLPDFKDILDNESEQSGDVVGIHSGDLYKQSQTHTNVDKYNPIAKKQKRDVVVRSREMKKMYVKDLEMKS
ncbi:hypothetical protein Goari_020205, partial [Gossypium aridum]|nr:hypothetical protein [Gossypium aridum]